MFTLVYIQRLLFSLRLCYWTFYAVLFRLLPVNNSKQIFSPTRAMVCIGSLATSSTSPPHAPEEGFPFLYYLCAKTNNWRHRISNITIVVFSHTHVIYNTISRGCCLNKQKSKLSIYRYYLYERPATYVLQF